MIFLHSKSKLIQSNFFKDYTDYHCHILPNVDDGIKTEKEALDTLYYYEQLGIKRVTCTPHVMNGTPNDIEHISQSFTSLCDHYSGEIILNLAAEYMLDSGFEQQLKNGLRTFELNENTSKYVLVETSCFSAPRNFYENLYNLSLENYIPTIAHPERYMYMNKEEYYKLKNKGYLLQLNLLSLSDYYGNGVRKKAEFMLKEGMYDLIGTDLHNLEKFKGYIEHLTVSKKQLDLLLELSNKFNG